MGPPPPTGEIVDPEREDRIAMPLAVQVPSLGAAIRIIMDEKSQRNVQGLCDDGGYPPVVGSAGQKTAFRDYDNVSHDLLPGDLANRSAGDGAHSGGLSTRPAPAMDPIPGRPSRR